VSGDWWGGIGPGIGRRRGRANPFFFSGAALLVLYTGALAPPPATEPDPGAGVRRGLAGVAAAWGLYSLIQGPPLILARPHPAPWRLVHGAAVAYLLALVYAACQTAAGARAALATVAPSLGARLPERSYGGDCAFTTPSRAINWAGLKATLVDEFVVAHVLGWWAKAVLLRDRALLWPLSLAFELAEACLAHALPNFNECWWDSWVLDAALCNVAGLEAGMATVAWLDRRTARAPLQGLSATPGALAKAARAAHQFTPRTWTRYDWRPTQGGKRGAAAFFLVAIFLLFDLHAFFLKAALWVPTTHPLVTGRIVLVFLLGVPAVKASGGRGRGGGGGRGGTRPPSPTPPPLPSPPQEYYEFATAPLGSRARLGGCAWLLLAVAAAEAAVCVKFADPPFRPATWHGHLAWLVSGAAAAGLAVAWGGGVDRWRRRQAKAQPRGRRPARGGGR